MANKIDTRPAVCRSHRFWGALVLASAASVSATPDAALAETLEFDGRIEAVHQADVYSRAEGIVAEVLVSQGDYVEAGTPLVRLQSDIAALSLASAEAELARTEALLTQARSRLARADRLATSGSASDVTLQQARTDLALATADRDIAETARTLAETHLNDTVIRAPIAGYVEDPKVRVGSLLEVNSGDPPIFQLVQLDPLRVTYEVPYAERFAAQEGKGAQSDAAFLARVQLQVALPGGPVLVERAAPDASAAWVDPTLGTIRVWATVENADGLLRPGMTVRVRSEIAPAPPSVSQ